MRVEPLVANVEARLLDLANAAESWEVVRWLSWVGDCFDGGDFEVEDFGNLRWRLEVLRGLVGEEATDPLIDACQAVLDTERTRRRNEVMHCGRLRTDTPPYSGSGQVGTRQR
jgi:hypothetical protein